jgi:hypothetical protein
MPTCNETSLWQIRKGAKARKAMVMVAELLEVWVRVLNNTGVGIHLNRLEELIGVFHRQVPHYYCFDNTEYSGVQS